jgi:hypothetical protein
VLALPVVAADYEDRHHGWCSTFAVASVEKIGVRTLFDHTERPGAACVGCASHSTVEIRLVTSNSQAQRECNGSFFVSLVLFFLCAAGYGDEP